MRLIFEMSLICADFRIKKAGACGNRTHLPRLKPGHNGFEDRGRHQAGMRPRKWQICAFPLWKTSLFRWLLHPADQASTAKRKPLRMVATSIDTGDSTTVYCEKSRRRG